MNCRHPEAKDGIHAARMPSFPDGMTEWFPIKLKSTISSMIFNQTASKSKGKALGALVKPVAYLKELMTLDIICRFCIGTLIFEDWAYKKWLLLPFNKSSF